MAHRATPEMVIELTQRTEALGHHLTGRRERIYHLGIPTTKQEAVCGKCGAFVTLDTHSGRITIPPGHCPGEVPCSS